MVRLIEPYGGVRFTWITSGSGRQVSKLCLGTMSMGSSAWKGWVLDEDDSIPILRHALDLGINFFDMADWYSTGGNEEVVGKNLLRMSARERLVLATKVYYPMSDDPNDLGLSRKHIASSIDRSLARMGTDYVDLYVIHAFDTAWDVEHRRPIASHASLHINAVAACPGDLAVTEDPLLISPWVARLDAKRRAGNGIAVPFHVAPTNRVRRPIVCADQSCAPAAKLAQATIGCQDTSRMAP